MSGTPTRAPRATGPDEAQHTNLGHQARQEGTPPATTKAQGQALSNNGHRVPHTWAARTTRNEPRHRNGCPATPNPDTPAPQPGVAGRSRNPSPHTHTHTAHPSLERRETSGARTQTHTYPDTPAKSGGAQPKPEPNHAHPSQEWRGTGRAHIQTHTHPNNPARSDEAQPKPEPKHPHRHRTPQSGVAGYKRSAHTNTHTPQHPS